MTTHQRYVDQVLVGTSAQLTQAVTTAISQRRLVSMTPPEPTTDGRYRIRVRLHSTNPQQATTRRTVATAARPRTRLRRRILIATGVVIAAAVALSVTAFAVTQLIAALAPMWPAILGALAVTGLIAALRASKTARHGGR